MKFDFKDSPTILNNFINYLISVKGYSLFTSKNYFLDLMLFFNFIKKYLNLLLHYYQFRFH